MYIECSGSGLRGGTLLAISNWILIQASKSVRCLIMEMWTNNQIKQNFLVLQVALALGKDLDN